MNHSNRNQPIVESRHDDPGCLKAKKCNVGTCDLNDGRGRCRVGNIWARKSERSGSRGRILEIAIYAVMAIMIILVAYYVIAPLK